MDTLLTYFKRNPKFYLPHHDETRVYQDERAGPPDAGGAVDDGGADALVQTAAVPDGAEELEEGVCGGSICQDWWIFLQG